MLTNLPLILRKINKIYICSLLLSTRNSTKMHSAFVKINKVPTRVTCWGKWIEESFNDGDSKDIVLMIAGNPGITGYYEKFLETIHQQTGYHVWVLSHAGHELPKKPSVMEMPSLENNHDLYDLKGQIAHKIAFIKQYVPQNARVHLLGHSIGAYMCTNILADPVLNEKIKKVYLLFPTIERMAVTPNGRFYCGVVQRIQWLLIFLAYFFALFPQMLQNALAIVVMFFMGMHRSLLHPTLTFCMPNVARAIMFLADDEMVIVKQRNDALISAHKQKIFVYCGQSDGWVPLSYAEDLKRDIPGLQVEIARKEFQHTFVLKHSHEMGTIMSDLIKTN